jgi:arylsulfatase A-like enzyme
VLDSFIYKKISNNKYGDSPTPFLDSIKDSVMFCENMYSQGPFTESGNKALLTGSNSLNNGGYMHNLNESFNIYLDVFHDAGYEVYDMYSPYYMYSEKHFNKIDHQFFSTDFQFGSVWEQRLKYFIKLNENRELTNVEYRDVELQLQLTFEAWSNLLNYEGNEERYLLIEKICKDYNFKKNEIDLVREYKNFKEDKRKYIDNLFQLKENHALFSIENMGDHKFIDPDFINKNVYGANAAFFRTLKWKQFYLNFKNTKISVSKVWGSIKGSLREKKLSGYLKQYIYLLFSAKISDHYTSSKFFKYMSSLRTFLNLSLKLIKEHRTDKPYFMHIHADDLHNRTSFFSYDTTDKKVIESEFSLYKNYVKSINKNYKGQIVYDLAIRYVDNCLAEFLGDLKSLGKLENTIVAITADHGCSYDCNPLRDRFVNNYNTENYHIPFLVINNDPHKGKIYSNYYTSKDILPTIYDICGIGKVKGIDGISLFSENYSPDVAISEYMGGGCPDMRLRDVHYIVRNKFFLLAYTVKLLEEFEKGKIVEAYNLINDPLEENNICEFSSEEHSQIKYLLSRIKVRHIELQNESN